MGVDVERGRGGASQGETKLASPHHGSPGSPLAGAEPVATVGDPESSPKKFPLWCRRCSALVAYEGGDLCGRCLGALKLDGGVQYMDHAAAAGGLPVALLVPWALLELAAAIAPAGAVLA